jgi:hypothetical protein
MDRENFRPVYFLKDVWRHETLEMIRVALEKM